MYFRRRASHYYNRFNEAEPIVRVIAIAGLALLLALTLPRFLPVTTSGVDCANLTAPYADGANESVLAQQFASQPNSTALLLEVASDRQTFDSGQPVVLWVRFINASVAPLTLFLVPESAIFRYNKEEIGLLIFMERVGQNNALGVQANLSAVLSQPQQYTSSQLHLLGPQQRCTVRVEIPATQLQAAGVGSGQFRIRMVYHNQSSGQVPSQNVTGVAAVFPNQGVWTGVVQSNDVLIAINPPVAAH